MVFRAAVAQRPGNPDEPSEGTRDAVDFVVMRYYDEEDPKKPAPVRHRRKGESGREASEHQPIEVGPKSGSDEDHAHVRC